MRTKLKLHFSCIWMQCHIILYYCTRPRIPFYGWHENWQHIQDACRKVYIDIWRISSIHHLLSIDATKTLLSAFVLPKLDYYNSLFYGSPMYMLERLQKVQNSAARLIFQCRKQNHISPLVMSLHWLPINARIEYKLSVICHSFFLGLSPITLSDLLLVYTPKRNLRSSPDNRILCIPKLRTKTFGYRSFSFCSPHKIEFFAFRAQTYWFYQKI